MTPNRRSVPGQDWCCIALLLSVPRTSQGRPTGRRDAPMGASGKASPSHRACTKGGYHTPDQGRVRDTPTGPSHTWRGRGHRWGTRTKTTRESLAQSMVRELIPWGSFLPCDFGSSFGTISQSVHRFLPPLEGLDVAVPNVHILHAHLSIKRIKRHVCYAPPAGDQRPQSPCLYTFAVLDLAG